MNKNPKWKEWSQVVKEITKGQIQDSLEIVHLDEETYLNELVAYQLQFEDYTYDQLTSKLVEVLVVVFQKYSLV